MFFFNTGYLFFVLLPILLLSLAARGWVQSTYARYSKVPNSTGQTGAQVAQRILAGSGLSHVQINIIDGDLTDNYDPRTKTLNLSRGAFGLVIAELGLALFAMVVLFNLVTTPVELNASHRALGLLAENGAILPEEQGGARRMLRAAAFTYWVALIASVLTLLYYASLVFGNRRNN